jgi:hypothetical protein
MHNELEQPDHLTFVKRRALVVQGLVDANRLLQPLALLRASSDRDDPSALLLSNLADDRASGTSGPADDESLSSLDLPDIEESLFVGR